MTLVELLVTVLILGLVLSVATTAFLSASRASDTIDHRVENLGQAQLLIRNAVKDIRTATTVEGPVNDQILPAIINATPWDITFYSYLNTPGTSPNKVRLYVNTTDPKNPTLVEQVWTPDAAATKPPTYSTPAKTRYVGQFITNTSVSGNPVFQYYNNVVLPAPVRVGTSANVPLTATQLAQVHAVLVTLKVRKTKNSATQGTTVESRIRLPNVIYTPPRN